MTTIIDMEGNDLMCLPVDVDAAALVVRSTTQLHILELFSYFVPQQQVRGVALRLSEAQEETCFISDGLFSGCGGV